MRTINADICKLIHIIYVLLILQRNIYFYLRQPCYLSKAGGTKSFYITIINYRVVHVIILEKKY